jgi:asparagine synthase (glutamine-hydrolysing)
MKSADGDHVLVYNGELYNFREIRRELESAGVRFRTRSDSEVLLEAWVRYGTSLLPKLDGMFAFAIWRISTRTLWLARDRFGIKPLYVANDADGRLLFASELKAILSADIGIDRAIVWETLADYLTLGYVPPGKGFLKGAEQLRPGECAEFDIRSGRLNRKRYWQPRLQEFASHEPTETLETLTWSAISGSVEAQLVADVPVASFLSGGVDSSAITAAMVGAYDSTATAYCIAVDSEGYNEVDHARQVARHLDVDLKVRNVQIADSDSIDRVAETYDEPFADSSCIPTALLCSFAAEDHKVALSGDGGDEVFAGYEWYTSQLMRERIRRVLGKAGTGAAAATLSLASRSIAGVSGRRIGAGLAEALQYDPIGAFVHNQSISSGVDILALLHPDIVAQLAGYDPAQQFRDVAAQAGTTDSLAVGQLLDMSFYLPGDILTKVDRAAMRSSLETRVPFLGNAVVEFANGLPRRSILPDGRRKGLLIDTVSTRLPPATLERRKQGFSVPVDHWFRSGLGDVLLGKLDASKRYHGAGILNTAACEKLFVDHVSGRRSHGAVLWAVTVLLGAIERMTG